MILRPYLFVFFFLYMCVRVRHVDDTMAGDGRTGEFDNGRDVNIDQQQQQHKLFVLVFDNARSTADTDDGDLLFYNSPRSYVCAIVLFYCPFLKHFVTLATGKSHQMSITISWGRFSRVCSISI